MYNSLYACTGDSDLDSDLVSSDDDDDDDDDDIDYFADVPSDSEGKGEEVKRAHYSDFFDAPDDEMMNLKTTTNRRGNHEVKGTDKLKVEGEVEEEEEANAEMDERDRESNVEEEEEGGGDSPEEIESEEGEEEEEEEEGRFGGREFIDSEDEEEEDGGEDESAEEEIHVREELFGERAPRTNRNGDEEAGEKPQTLSSHERKQLKVSLCSQSCSYDAPV